jgi:hypothetical protein
MPNPASAFCTFKAGASQILTGPDGAQTGFCSFGGPDSTIEEWTLFRSVPPAPGAGVSAEAPAPRQSAVTAFLSGGNGFPPLAIPTGHGACSASGAETVTYTCALPLCTLGAPTLAACSFHDGSQIAAEALAAVDRKAQGTKDLRLLLTGRDA